MSFFSLEGKTALVTGCKRGIGFAMAEALAEAGADIITIHPEATKNLDESIKEIRKFKKKVGISLNPKTSVDKVLPVLNLIDLVLVMIWRTKIY